MKLLDAVLEKFQYHLQYIAGYGKYFLQILFLLFLPAQHTRFQQRLLIGEHLVEGTFRDAQ